MNIVAGQQLLHYRVIEKIGEGGMGVVWRAVDTTLDRDVAIKILPELFSADSARMARFEREAKTLASLNHPCIAGIYGLHETDGARFIAMELVGGEDLAERISRGALTEEDALDVARQVAQALEAAHEIGVIHRDLKPANIRLTPEGQVKVLDFGLAKALDPGSSNPGSDALGLSPTVTSTGTMAGTILGTAAYMSPEQAKGKAVDRRADVWAFGCVLYEMLTGRQLFQADTVSETLAAVLMTDPAYDELPARVSTRTRWLLQRCLTKDPQTRLRDIGEARVAVEHPDSWVPHSEVAADGAVATSSLPRWVLPLGAAAVAGTAFLLGTFVRSPEPAAPIPLRKFEISRDAVHRNFDNPPVLSPDGQRIAYVHEDGVWIRDFARLEARRLVASGDTPFWSADGRQVAYDEDEKLWRIGVDGGEPSLICDLPVRGRLVSAVWAPDGTVWFAAWRGGLYRVPARGGDPELVLEIQENEVDFHDVSLLPGGSGVIFVNHQRNPESGEWIRTNELLVLRDGERHEVTIDPGIITLGGPVFSRGHLLYERRDAAEGIWAVPFSPAKLETIGDPFLVVAGAVQPSVADDGTLTYLPAAGDETLPEIQLVWVNRQGRELGPIGGPHKQHPYLSLSPDGKRVAIAAGEKENESDIWIHDLERRGFYQLTHEDGADVFPVWSADGRKIYYMRDPPNCDSPRCLEQLVRPSDGSGSAELLGTGSPPAPTPDDSAIVYVGMSRDGLDVFRIPLAGNGQASPLIGGTGYQYFPRISPDGRYIAYMSWPGERVDVFLAPYPDAGKRWQVSMEGGEWPHWNAKGDRIYYVQGFDVMEVEVTYEPTVQLSRPKKLFALQDHLFDGGQMGGTPFFAVTGDGERFVVTRVDETVSPDARGIVVVQNWVSEFESR